MKTVMMVMAAFFVCAAAMAELITTGYSRREANPVEPKVEGTSIGTDKDAEKRFKQMDSFIDKSTRLDRQLEEGRITKDEHRKRMDALTEEFAPPKTIDLL